MVRLFAFISCGLIAGLAAACVPLTAIEPATPGTMLGSHSATVEAATATQELYPVLASTAGSPDVTAAAIIATKSAGGTEAALPTATPQPTGIHEFGELWAIPGQNVVIYVENTWYGLVNGTEVRVFAGSYPDSEQGVLYVAFPQASHWFEDIYKTPTQVGPIRVVEDRDDRLKLSARNGDVFYFDIPGLQFTTAYDESVPTVTPPAETAIIATGYP